MAAKKKGVTKKKAVPGKRKTSSRKQRSGLIHETKKVLLGLAILVALCLSVAMIADIMLKPGRQPKKAPVQKETVAPGPIKPIQEGITSESRTKHPSRALKEKSAGQVVTRPAEPESSASAAGKMIPYEVFDDVDHGAAEKPVLPKKGQLPEIAIIIDDIGYDKKTALALSDLDSNITFSVLPFAPFGRFISEKLHEKKVQLMLHLPMEPVEYPDVDPGPGALLSSMPPDVLLEQLKKNLKDIPYIKGVNNHMGSKLTMSADQMNQIFTILKKQNLFFIDSRTAPKSQCKASARLLKIRFGQRDVFLDNIQDVDYITGQFHELIRVARKHGSAIGIGHPYRSTLEALSRELPRIKGKITIVRASDLTIVPT